VAFVTERLNGEDGLGGIYPAMANTVMMFDALGYRPDHPHAVTAWNAVRKLIVIKEDGAYCQPCFSPVWDTALAGHAMAEVGYDASAACAWLLDRQILEVPGDWRVRRPDLRPGGWAFQYANPHYPDVDDTAVVGMLLDRNADPAHHEAIARAREWIIGMQSTGRGKWDGGWGAFEPENTHLHLNHIPFADHGALLDPPTADVTARCVSFLAQIGMAASEPVMQRALGFLRRDQERDGSWFGRWGVNYIYGTWSVLCALNAAGVLHDDPMMRKAVDWLASIQNADGGWGEDGNSYKLNYQGYEPSETTASQTAWATLALMAAGQVDHPATQRGISYLIGTQEGSGLWHERHYTGGGFPRVFYLRYHGYSKFFPLWALARYRNLRKTNSRFVGVGM
jgi:squalene-hopene/tetraprenyl-beta-curcumene cyclase